MLLKFNTNLDLGLFLISIVNNVLKKDDITRTTDLDSNLISTCKIMLLALLQKNSVRLAK